MTATILVVDDSEVVTKLVEFQLADAGYNILVAHDGAAGLKMAKEHKPDLVILDVEMPEMNGYEVCRRLREIHATAKTPIIMVTALSNIANMQAGFEAGADDYITKPFKSAELQMRVDAMLRRSASSSTAAADSIERQTIAVFSLRGGAGCSSLAVNLAIGQSRIWGTESVLLDLAMPVGSCEMLLDLQPKYSLNTLVDHNISSFDEDLIVGHLTRHSSGLSLFAGIQDPTYAELVTENVVSLVIDHLQNHSRYLVIDTAHNFSPATLAALDAADIIILPITPDIVSVRSTATALRIFDSLGYARDKIEVIVNWTFPQAGIEKQRIEKFINHSVRAVIPNTPDFWSQAINVGQPVIMQDEKLPLVALLEDLAWDLSTETDRASKVKNRSEMWKRVAKRRWKRRADQYEHKRSRA